MGGDDYCEIDNFDNKFKKLFKKRVKVHEKECDARIFKNKASRL